MDEHGPVDIEEAASLLESDVTNVQVESTLKKKGSWALLYVFPPALYIIGYVFLDILIASSGAHGGYRYDPVSLIMFTEFLKFMISLGLWLYSTLTEPQDSKRDKDASSIWMYYIFPAVLYTIWSVLNFHCLLTVSLATFSVLYQSVVFFTAVAWIIAFNETISAKQWVALSLLCGGCLCAQITPDLRFEVNYAMLFVFVQSGLSAVASVINEVLLKKPVPINEQNTYLYSFSLLASAAWLCVRRPGILFAPYMVFEGFDRMTYFIAVLAAMIGLLVTLILKHTNVIVKVYAQAFHAPLEIVMAHFTIHTPLGYMTLVSSAVIMGSSLWYYSERQAIKLKKEMEDRLQEQQQRNQSKRKEENFTTPSKFAANRCSKSHTITSARRRKPSLKPKKLGGASAASLSSSPPARSQPPPSSLSSSLSSRSSTSAAPSVAAAAPSEETQTQTQKQNTKPKKLPTAFPVRNKYRVGPPAEPQLATIDEESADTRSNQTYAGATFAALSPQCACSWGECDEVEK
mmetsp:Transcript_30131/g.52971  ORF Transcript_30131/g.52971 Transcript_30131/m.52971 type:complete len:517 (+) Transcript_30131:130-1680(+)